MKKLTKFDKVHDRPEILDETSPTISQKKWSDSTHGSNRDPPQPWVDGGVADGRMMSSEFLAWNKK